MLKPRLLSELGEQLCPWSSPNARTDDHLKLATNLVNLRPAIGWEQPDTPAMEEFKQLAEKEKHAALRLQEEVNICNPQVNHVKKVINTDILEHSVSWNSKSHISVSRGAVRRDFIRT